MDMKYILRYQLGDDAWGEFLIDGNRVLIGRGDDCDLVLDHAEASRNHVLLERINNQFQITDLGSSNGTRLDDQTLSPHSPANLSPGQEFFIGMLRLVLSAPASDATRIMENHEQLVAFHLRYRKKDGPWQTRELPLGDMVLGRDEGADLYIDDSEMSRQHARLNVSEGMIWLTDLGSTNGTKIDGALLAAQRRYPLELGYFFSIGQHAFMVEQVGSAGNAYSGTMMMPNDIVGQVAAEMVNRTMLDTDSHAPPTSVRTMDLASHDQVTIGRHADNQVVLNHPLVSSYHAVLERMGKRFCIKDLRSTNGIYVNEQRVEREAYLKDWDQIRIGPYVFVLSGQQLQGQVETGIRIEAKNINQQVSSALNLLKNINLTIESNEFLALVGMSGSGKSTLMNAISGYWPASHGRVLVNGIDLYEHYDLFRNDIGYVPQKDIVHAELTPNLALDYVAQLRMPPDTSPEERRAVVAEVLRDLDLTERRDIPISRLSGGQLKRVSIGVELLTKPRLFFLDEPTSGLDPGTEYDMMKLMRRLADQGRTIVLITHATKNVMLCDKVIFLARGGNLAFYGAPEDGLKYFDHYRTDRERRERDMEFDEIYRILSDESRGAPEAWRERYLHSQVYANIAGASLAAAGVATGPQAGAPAQAGAVRKSKRRVSSLRQFMILSARNIKIIMQDKVSMAMMLALAPILGLMDFIWGRDLFDPVIGDVELVMSQWYMLAIISILAGALSSVREIVKEADIYKRERAVNLRIFPYVASKIWIGVVLAIYQAAILMAFRVFFVQPNLPGAQDYIAFYITLLLGSLSGYLLGLTISAVAPNQNTAMLLLITILVPQFLFSGALLPLESIPGGRATSLVMSSRWVFEGFVKVSHMGDKIVDDPCLAFPPNDRQHLPNEIKESCDCMGESIFTDCADFPGILSPDFYDELAQEMLALPEPIEPVQPTAYAFPTALPTLTPIFTPTPLASPTPLPTPADPRQMDSYMDAQRAQGQEQQDAFMDQFEAYRIASQDQGQVYADQMDGQGDAYADLRQAQGDEYSEAMQDYGDDRSEWQKNREKAINSAETMLGSMVDEYGYVFEGSIITRWVALIFVMGGLGVIMLIFQKRKDVV